MVRKNEWDDFPEMISYGVAVRSVAQRVGAISVPYVCTSFGKCENSDVKNVKYKLKHVTF